MNKNKTRIIVLIIFAIFALTVITGCGGGNKADSGAQKAKIAYYAFNSEPVLDWDPSVEFSNGIVVMNNIYEPLLRFDPMENKVTPVLAEEYTKSEDGLTWVFKLRKGVKFHDGTEMKADAVKFSIERTKELNQGAAYIWDAVQEINIKDDYTVEFKLSYPAPLDLIASCGYAAFIMSPKVAEQPEDWFSQGNEAGTGPYKLQSTKMGEEVVLTKFDAYWQGWEGNHFDKVIIKKVPETSSRRQLVEKGEADVTIELPYEDVEALKNNANVQIMDAPSFQNLFFCFNTEKEPLNNKLVRQALSYAFPYEDVVKYAMGSYATQAKGPIPYGHWGHGENLFQYKYDLNKAKELLAQAGLPNGGFKLLLTYMSGDEAEKKAAELYKAELAKLNIDLEVRGMPWDSQWEMAKSKDPKNRQDILGMYWWVDYASPYSWLYSLFHSEEEVLFNLNYYKNDKFDQLIDDANAKSGIDRAAAEKMYIDAQQMLIEDVPSVFAYDKQYVWVFNKQFKGLKSNAAYPNTIFFYDTYRE
ncbi:ABC transporter substrate-binding protein [Desulfotomaculum sp. 1211_IL3151]|uniref:ABC transporter substrate-binding protein n=1 Tax=Desulfotomaculum sp. 1211_IL3151 TaxID=3084055 RepID=UPI002FDA6682